MTAAEHFAWARDRALRYCDAGDPVTGLDSLVSDLAKHDGTAGILHPDLVMLLYTDYLVSGPRVIRQHIETLAGPSDTQPIGESR